MGCLQMLVDDLQRSIYMHSENNSKSKFMLGILTEGEASWMLTAFSVWARCQGYCVFSRPRQIHATSARDVSITHVPRAH